MNKSIICFFLLTGLVTGCKSAQKNTSSAMDQKGKNAVQFVGNPAEKKVDVLIGGDLFTSYIYPDNIAKPTLYPLITSTGKRLTRGFPLDPQPGTSKPGVIG